MECPQEDVAPDAGDECRLAGATKLSFPPAAKRWLVSLLVVLHLLAILSAVTSYSTVHFRAPALAVWANRPFRPYLQLTQLNNAYRFFAPNPGTPTVLWFRVQHQDGSLSWLEMPRRSNSWPGVAYQRRLTQSLQLAQHLSADPLDPEQPRLSEFGSIWLASYVRHVAKAAGPGQVKTVGIYFVQHAAISPEQARLGWERIDLRTYRATFAGAFRPDGERIDEFRPDMVAQPMEYVAAGILDVDVYPLLRRHAGEDPLAVVEPLRLPTPIHRLLTRFPELLDAGKAHGDLTAQIEELVEGATATGEGSSRPATIGAVGGPR